ncbi:macrolide family glycosyltransferase [Paenibacillus turpanensis]|uniref:macrolide family glycosyltransferase n=1 Tax=Paenibacillus turpanensis TaxID=2689078 RepID=UPI001408AD04
MSKIVFFSIPAYGHTNPTLPVVSELVSSGHQVWYYSFHEFQEKIESTGTTFISCDEFLPPISEEELNRKVGKDFAALIEMVADTTIALDEKVCTELRAFQPDCIVSDSLCFWGKLFAKKLEIPYICSTTSFAFNKHTAKLMKRSINEIFKMIVAMPRINKKMEMLRSHGYEVESFISIVQNDNETDTIVYTSEKFQPMAETFSNRYAFVGPSIWSSSEIFLEEKNGKVIYISLGTVLNQNKDFYQNCIEAFADSEYVVVMSVGEKTDITLLGQIPKNFIVKNRVDQMAVLKQTDAFITHCGMNSVNESLYYGVPMVLFPLHSEQRVVANRVAELKAGVLLKRSTPKNLKKAVADVIGDRKYRENAQQLTENLRGAGGAVRAAKVILQVIGER